MSILGRISIAAERAGSIVSRPPMGRFVPAMVPLAPAPGSVKPGLLDESGQAVGPADGCSTCSVFARQIMQLSLVIMGRGAEADEAYRALSFDAALARAQALIDQHPMTNIAIQESARGQTDFLATARQIGDASRNVLAINTRVGAYRAYESLSTAIRALEGAIAGAQGEQTERGRAAIDTLWTHLQSLRSGVAWLLTAWDLFEQGIADERDRLRAAQAFVVAVTTPNTAMFTFDPKAGEADLVAYFRPFIDQTYEDLFGSKPAKAVSDAMARAAYAALYTDVPPAPAPGLVVSQGRSGEDRALPLVDNNGKPVGHVVADGHLGALAKREGLTPVAQEAVWSIYKAIAAEYRYGSTTDVRAMLQSVVSRALEQYKDRIDGASLAISLAAPEGVYVVSLADPTILAVKGSGTTAKVRRIPVTGGKWADVAAAMQKHDPEAWGFWKGTIVLREGSTTIYDDAFTGVSVARTLGDAGRETVFNGILEYIRTHPNMPEELRQVLQTATSPRITLIPRSIADYIIVGSDGLADNMAAVVRAGTVERHALVAMTMAGDSAPAALVADKLRDMADPQVLALKGIGKASGYDDLSLGVLRLADVIPVRAPTRLKFLSDTVLSGSCLSDALLVPRVYAADGAVGNACPLFLRAPRKTFGAVAKRVSKWWVDVRSRGFFPASTALSDDLLLQPSSRVEGDLGLIGAFVGIAPAATNERYVPVGRDAPAERRILPSPMPTPRPVARRVVPSVSADDIPGAAALRKYMREHPYKSGSMLGFLIGLLCTNNDACFDVVAQGGEEVRQVWLDRDTSAAARRLEAMYGIRIFTYDGMPLTEWELASLERVLSQIPPELRSQSEHTLAADTPLTFVFHEPKDAEVYAFVIKTINTVNVNQNSTCTTTGWSPAIGCGLDNVLLHEILHTYQTNPYREVTSRFCPGADSGRATSCAPQEAFEEAARRDGLTFSSWTGKKVSMPEQSYWIPRALETNDFIDFEWFAYLGADYVTGAGNDLERTMPNTYEFYRSTIYGGHEYELRPTINGGLYGARI